jgi:ketosteroid isomerase-like protein
MLFPASRAFRIARPRVDCDDGSMTDEEAIRAIIEAQIDAFRRKDAAAAVALLSADVVAFEMIPPLVLPPELARSVQAMTGWFAGWEGPVNIELRDLVIHVSGDVGFSHSLNRLSGTRLGGGITDIWVRSTLGFRKSASGWRIVHGHTSVPFDPADNFRARLDLKP